MTFTGANSRKEVCVERGLLTLVFFEYILVVEYNAKKIIEILGVQKKLAAWPNRTPGSSDFERISPKNRVFCCLNGP